MNIKRSIDTIDGKIIALFEKRMLLVKKSAKEKDKSDLRKEQKRRFYDAADKTIKYACDVETIAYTEELVKLLMCMAVKYQKKLIKQRKK